MLLLGGFAWMACNFVGMAAHLNGLCMLSLMLQLWALWGETNKINSKIVAPPLHYTKSCARFWHHCQVSYFFIPTFSIKNYEFASSKCCTSSQSSIANILAFMHLHLISLHTSITCNFSVFLILWLAHSAHGQKNGKWNCFTPTFFVWCCW
jgi:hypothetical protein